MTDLGDKAVQRARRRLAELEAEVERLKIFLSVYDEFANGVAVRSPSAREEVAYVRGLVTGESELFQRNHESRPVTGNSEAPPTPKGMSQADFEEFVRTLLIEHGRPAPIAEIIAMVHNRGRHIGGRDEAGNAKTKIWRAKRTITMIPGAGYWPKDVPCPAVSYDPQQSS